jgi:signal transduction histidine kinase
VGDAQRDLSRLAELAGGLGLHEHLCVIYDTQEEQFAAAVPFLRSGLERHQRCLYVADENSTTAVLDALRRSGTDVDRYLRSGALALADKPWTYHEHGRFDPDWWIRFLAKAAQEPGTAEFSGMRTLLGEMTWTIRQDIAPDVLIEFEAKVNGFVLDHDVRALCQYNRNQFSPELILGVLRTHPVVVYGGIVCKNPYYIPPEEFLKPNQASREVERLLNNILRWQQSLDQLRALAARLQSAREEERTRIAREIHDELGQALTAIKIDLAALIRDLPGDSGPQRQRSQSILKLLDEAIQSVRRIATELRPGILDDLGLVAAVEWAAEEFQARTGTTCELSLPGVDIALDPERATALFRILQETLTNVARHTNATRVDIRLAQENGDLILEVNDNGQGIGEEHPSESRSLGILGMRERALLLGGELTISGEPGKGTTVRVRIPQPNRKEPESSK